MQILCCLQYCYSRISLIFINTISSIIINTSTYDIVIQTLFIIKKLLLILSLSNIRLPSFKITGRFHILLSVKMVILSPYGLHAFFTSQGGATKQFTHFATSTCILKLREGIEPSYLDKCFTSYTCIYIFSFGYIIAYHSETM